MPQWINEIARSTCSEWSLDWMRILMSNSTLVNSSRSPQSSYFRQKGFLLFFFLRYSGEAAMKTLFWRFFFRRGRADPLIGTYTLEIFMRLMVARLLVWPLNAWLVLNALLKITSKCALMSHFKSGVQLRSELHVQNISWFKIYYTFFFYYPLLLNIIHTSSSIKVHPCLLLTQLWSLTHFKFMDVSSGCQTPVCSCSLKQYL